MMNPWIVLPAGLIAGAVTAWLIANARQQARAAKAQLEAEGRVRSAESALAEVRRQLEEMNSVRGCLESEQKARITAETRFEEAKSNLEEQRRLLDEARAKLAEAFQALSAEALKSNNQAFMELAKSAFETVQAEVRGDLEIRQKELGALVSPLKETLDRYQERVQQMELAREKAYGSLEEQLRSLASVNQQLQKEAGTLASALKGGPGVRGRWGEMTLRRAAELAGMAPHCDFAEQETFISDAGRLRPDMIVNLPGGRRIAVDAKAPLEAFLLAAAAETTAERVKALERHSALVRDHMNKLASKSYWEQFDHSPEIVVLFLPGESFFSAALEQDHELMEDGMKKKVVLATPTTLVALLKAAAYGWRQESIEENAREIRDLGQQLHDRLRVFLDHFLRAGAALSRSVAAYNEAAASLESRVLVPARKFKELGAASGSDLAEARPLEASPRELVLPERDGLS